MRKMKMVEKKNKLLIKINTLIECNNFFKAFLSNVI